MENLKEVEIPGKTEKDGNTSWKFEGQNAVKKSKVPTYRQW